MSVPRLRHKARLFYRDGRTADTHFGEPVQAVYTWPDRPNGCYRDFHFRAYENRLFEFDEVPRAPKAQEGSVDASGDT